MPPMTTLWPSPARRLFAAALPAWMLLCLEPAQAQEAPRPAPAASAVPSATAAASAPHTVTIRTETYPRPPYSGATYYLYERDGAVVCTKLSVCNKFNQCQTSYHLGAFKDAEDVATGAPYGSTEPVPIPGAKLRRHQCLVRHRLL
jgi:hypothetical protein